MKYLFTIAVVIGLASCGGTDECCDAPIIPQDTTLLPDSVAMNNMLHGDSLVRLNVDSIANVSDLLDTLAAYEPKMTH